MTPTRYAPRNLDEVSECEFINDEDGFFYTTFPPGFDEKDYGSNAYYRRGENQKIGVIAPLKKIKDEALSQIAIEEAQSKHDYFLALCKIGAIPSDSPLQLFFYEEEGKITDYRLVVPHLPGISLATYYRDIRLLCAKHFSVIPLVIIPLYKAWCKLERIHAKTYLVHGGLHDENILVNFNEETNSIKVNFIDGGYSRTAGTLLRKFKSTERRSYQAPELFLYELLSKEEQDTCALADIEQDVYSLAITSLSTLRGDLFFILQDDVLFPLIKDQMRELVAVLKGAAELNQRLRLTSRRVIAEFEKMLTNLIDQLNVFAKQKRRTANARILNTIHLLENGGAKPTITDAAVCIESDKKIGGKPSPIVTTNKKGKSFFWNGRCEALHASPLSTPLRKLKLPRIGLPKTIETPKKTLSI